MVSALSKLRFQSSIGMHNNLISIVMEVWPGPWERRKGYLDLWKRGRADAEGLLLSLHWVLKEQALLDNRRIKE